MFKDHPKGLPILFFTEMWERVSFYGMRALLVLFLTAETVAENPGFGWTNAEALGLYGWYTMMVYLMGIPGGIVADKFLGQKKSVLIGGLLIAAGQLTLILDNVNTFYAGLGLIICGVGLLKPNISTMVGQLYKPGDNRRDTGFMIFYIGINVGATIAPIVAGILGEGINFKYGFAFAGFGMLFGQAIYLWGHKYLKGIGEFVKKAKEETKTAAQPLTKIEKDRIVVIVLACILIIFFWAAYEQAGGLLNLYTSDKINRSVFGWEIPASVFQFVPAAFVVIMGMFVSNYWNKRRKAGKETSSLFKMAIGMMITGSGFIMMVGASLEAVDGQKAMLIWLISSYFLQVIGELSLSPVSLSFVTKLAPARYGSIMMGVLFASTGVGNKLAGLIGQFAQTAGELEIFIGIFVYSLVLGLLVILFLKKLKALTHGAEEVTEA
ncbi:MAG: peptide MFS transporter [Rhodothermaceae bacterium]